MSNQVAVFIDFENVALWAEQEFLDFELTPLMEYLQSRGPVVIKRVYGDWSRFARYREELMNNSVDLIQIYSVRAGKNRADIRMALDALETAISRTGVRTFVIVSGDSDFSPLVAKLKENGKHVIGLGIKESTSDLLSTSCDEFIFYDDLELSSLNPPSINPELPQKNQAAFKLLIESIEALMRENKPILYSSMVKDTMKRKRPSFTESYYGYRTFSDLLEDAETNHLIELNVDSRSGTYVIVGFSKKKKARRRGRPSAKSSKPKPKTEAGRQPV